MNGNLVVRSTVLGEEWVSLDVGTLWLSKNGDITLSGSHCGGSVWASLSAGGASNSGGGVCKAMWAFAVTAHLVASTDNLILANVDNFGHGPTTLVSDVET